MSTRRPILKLLSNVKFDIVRGKHVRLIFIILTSISFVGSSAICQGQDDSGFLCATHDLAENVHADRDFPSEFICGNTFRVFYWVLREDDGTNGVYEGIALEDYLGDIHNTLNQAFAFSEVNLMEVNSPYAYIDDDIYFESLGYDYIDNSLALNQYTNPNDFIQNGYFRCDAINIYVGGLASGACGIANNANGEASIAGLWVKRTCHISTYAHEMGHVFGLAHIFSNTPGFNQYGNIELGDGVCHLQSIEEGNASYFGSSCDISGDFICDTYPQPQIFAFTIDCDWNANHPSNIYAKYVPLDCTSPINIEELDQYDTYPFSWVDNEYDNVDNFMNYSPPSCWSKFTPLQSLRMMNHATFSTALLRASCGAPEYLISVNPMTCADVPDGSISFAADSDSGPLEIECLSCQGSFEEEYVFAPLPAGSYSFNIYQEIPDNPNTTVDESLYCPIAADLEVIVPLIEVDIDNLIELTSQATNCANSNNGTISVELDESISSGNVHWTGPNGYTSNLLQINGLDYGWYFLSIVDNDVCVSDQIYVDQSNDFTIELFSVSTCQNSTPSGMVCFSIQEDYGMTFPVNWTLLDSENELLDSGVSIDNTEECIENLEAGWYTLEVSTIAGCYESLNVEILETSILLEIAQNCINGSSVVVSVDLITNSDNYNLIFTEEGLISESFDNLVYSIDACGSDVIVELNDLTNGCSTQQSIALQCVEPPAVEFSIYEPCPGGYNGAIQTEVANGSGDYSFTWIGISEFLDVYYSDNQNLDAIQAGTYFLDIVDNQTGCSLNDVLVVIQNGQFSYLDDILISSQAQLDVVLSNGSASFGADLVFLSGTFNIEDRELGFGIDSRILISEEAEVSFNNCTFTSCGQHWRGFDVQADHSSSVASGKLTLNNCRIEYAETGIYTSDEGLTNLSLTQRHGGNILCTSTTFSNCRVAFEAYKATKLSGQNLPGVGFRKCRFELDDQMLSHFPDSEGAYNQFSNLVRLNESYGYSFQGCTFENSMVTNIEQWSNRGRAIRSSKSVYNVESYQINVNDPAIRSSFSGFDVAIDATQASKRAVIVRFSDFEKNRVGIRLTNMPFFQVYENTFSIGELVEADPLNTQNPNTQDVVVVGYEDQVEETAPIWYEGIFVNGGHSFVLAENSFDGVWESEGGVNDDFTRIGVRVRDTKTKDDEIRLNTFQDLTVANLANGDNADATNNSGLRYICNTHIDNRFDIQVDDYAGASDVAIDIVQDDVSNDGEETPWSADNTFTQDLDILEEAGRIWNDGITVTYYYDGSEHDPGIEVYNVNAFDLGSVEPNDCLEEWHSDNEHTVAHINGLLTRASEIEADVIANEVLFLSVLDQGSTADLKQQIENAYGEDVLDKRDYLLSISPHVSQTVLRTVADRTDQYPHPIALEIFLANPDVLRDNRFIAYLSAKADPMPQYMIDLLLAASSQSTQRTIIMNEWNRVQTIYTKNINRAIWSMSYLDEYNESDLEEVIGEWKFLASEFDRIDRLLDVGDIAGAEMYFDQVLLTYYLPEDLELETTLFGEWMSLRTTLINSGRSWKNLTSFELDELYNLVDHYKTWVGRSAMQVLNENNSEIFELPPAFSQQWDPRLVLVSNTSQQFASVFPNPADFVVNFLVHCPSADDKSGTLRIFDGTGRLVLENPITESSSQFIIDVSRWSTGIYMYEIVLPAVGKQSGKIDVQH